MEVVDTPIEESVTLTETVTLNAVNDTDAEVNAFSASLDDIQNQIETFVKDMKSMSNELKNSKKRYLKIVKTLSKTKKRKTSSANQDDANKKEPSGFISPIEISDELADFMNVQHKTMIPRTVVTKHIIAFIKENQLESKANGRNFDLTDPSNPNAVALKKLFNIERGDEVTYFNLQSFLKPHFVSLPKKTKTSSGGEKEESKDLPSDDATAVDTAEVTKKMRVGKKKSKKAAAVTVNAAEDTEV